MNETADAMATHGALIFMMSKYGILDSAIEATHLCSIGECADLKKLSAALAGDDAKEKEKALERLALIARKTLAIQLNLNNLTYSVIDALAKDEKIRATKVEEMAKIFRSLDELSTAYLVLCDIEPLEDEESAPSPEPAPAPAKRKRGRPRKAK